MPFEPETMTPLVVGTPVQFFSITSDDDNLTDVDAIVVPGYFGPSNLLEINTPNEEGYPALNLGDFVFMRFADAFGAGSSPSIQNNFISVGSNAYNALNL